MDVKIDELRSIANALFSHLENDGAKSLTLSVDYYWDVPEDTRYDSYEKPRELTLGQLTDDMTELTRMLNGERPMVAYGLVWLAAILRRVGETANR